MDKPRSIDHDSGFNIDVLSVRAEEEPVLKIGEGVPEWLLPYHPDGPPFDKWPCKIFSISLQFLSTE